MCLRKLEKFKPRYIGYKVFRKVKGGYLPVVQHTPMCKMGEWITDENDGVLVAGIVGTGYLFHVYKEPYHAGFHVFETLKGVKAWRGISGRQRVIVKVRYRKVVATGYQVGHKVVVARKMCLLEEMKK